MSKLGKVIKVARIATNMDIGRNVTNCIVCDKKINGHKKNVCSIACAQFATEHGLG